MIDNDLDMIEDDMEISRNHPQRSRQISALGSNGRKYEYAFLSYIGF
jgi:hypothetical protein